MNKSNYLKRTCIKTYYVFFIIISLANSYLLLSNFSSTIDIDQNSIQQILNQALNTTSEISSLKGNTKLLTESFANKFYSNEYFARKLSHYPKTIIIISETSSEKNIRHSSFLIAQSTTST